MDDLKKAGNGSFPSVRLRRLRRTKTLRRMFCETRLDTSDLICPLFVVPGTGVRQEIQSLPANYHLSIDRLPREVEEVCQLGIPAVMLFGIPENKDEVGSEAYAASGTVQKAVRLIKGSFPDLAVVTDVCLCQYTSHGHCGIMDGLYVNNDRTLEFLARVAVSHAEAGADIVAPSDMMDGRIRAIRAALDARGLDQTIIMSYAAKYASAFYGPFRDAAGSAPKSGDRRSYQMDISNVREALREIELDIAEGADIVMVKPALPYLDVIRRVRDKCRLPVAAYSVSGEYCMIRSAADRDWLDERQAAMEVITAIKRAGADLIITYHARQIARWLAEDD